MDDNIYKKIKLEYDYKRNKKIQEAKLRKQQIIEKIPKLQKLEEQKDDLAINTAKIVLNCDNIEKQVKIENLGLQIKEIDKKILKVLNENGLSIKDIEPNFDCKICNDTGIISQNGKTKYCSCFLQKIINNAYAQSNMNRLDEENFDSFDIGFYSNKKNKEKYGIDKSPYENIMLIKSLAEKFCVNIDSKCQKNLLFVGNTGLGKTFLANCIANDVIKSCHTVVYQTAPMLMDSVINYKFSYNRDEYAKQQYNQIFDVDLLIIDDLGTETMSSNKFTELFNIINTRLLKNKKMVISTNLTLNELYQEYDERVMSRLIGNFTICKFIGDDIRLKKKKISC